MPRGEFDRSGQRARTRTALLEAAARVYARRGFDAATLDEVAEEAGFTKGAVYDHFGSKEKLLFALLDEHLAAQIAEQIELFDPAQSPAERPRAGSDRWMVELEEDPDAFRLFVEAWVHGQRDEEFRARVAAGVDQWRATFQSFGRARTHASTNSRNASGSASIPAIHRSAPTRGRDAVSRAESNSDTCSAICVRTCSSSSANSSFSLLPKWS